MSDFYGGVGIICPCHATSLLSDTWSPCASIRHVLLDLSTRLFFTEHHHRRDLGHQSHIPVPDLFVQIQDAIQQQYAPFESVCLDLDDPMPQQGAEAQGALVTVLTRRLRMVLLAGCLKGDEPLGSMLLQYLVKRYLCIKVNLVDVEVSPPRVHLPE